MLKELATLSIGMLFLGGYVADMKTARILARGDLSGHGTQNVTVRPRHERAGVAEVWALALIWLVTPGLLFAAAAGLLHTV